ncbi:MAG TPA: prenyltransferase/squalene oxidase repeat-containing protein [Planctomycetota bacterium]|nr:prenyltransferase/squalene oxidase repeat-containing protein [Planctomycetota bacterium]
MHPSPRTLAPLLLAPLLALAPLRARADEETPTLAKFREPVDKAIDRALEYLAKHQESDGSFASSGMRRSTAITSLALMAFLAKGHTPGQAPYGDILNRGIDFVIAAQQWNGMLVGDTHSHGPMYSHTIATLMLSEVSGMVTPDRQKRVDAALGKALRLILAAQKMPKPQHHKGGWRYQHNSNDSDISCTGWALMSLRAARNSGAAVPREAIDDAIQFVLNCRQRDGGFGYQPGGGSGMARTGTALLCLELCGRHRTKETIAGGDWILRHMRDGDSDGFFYYAIYYTAQGMFQLGDEHWEKFAENMYGTLLKKQERDGSWSEGRGNEARAGRCYSTAMAVLALTPAYRQLPIYQR